MDRHQVLNDRLLAVHVNYLGRKDASLLGRRKVSVAHCPRSHDYFRHDHFPFSALAKARVNVCLGTDSLATVFRRRGEKVELNMFEEMRAFAHTHPRTSPKTILRMATMNGARALGLGGHAGEISRGALADFIALPFSGSAKRVYRAVLHHKGEVAASMIDGEWAIAPH
jgi:cytosine/adenosine deaminase-related metal-dependent hydrolase